jgi:hypothetical protein
MPKVTPAARLEGGRTPTFPCADASASSECAPKKWGNGLTIAGYYLTPEGIVLGADSTSSALTESGMHYLDFNQKIFQLGESSTLGLMTWGLGAIGTKSYRTLVAELADQLKSAPPQSVAEVTQRWTDMIWPLYDASPLALRFKALAAKPSAAAKAPGSRTDKEEKEFANLSSGLVLGFCIAGYVLPDRTPVACWVSFAPNAAKPTPTVVTAESAQWWGVPNIVSRLVLGSDPNLRAAILNSKKWSGTPGELDAILATQRLAHSSLPIRDAVDYVHSCIYSTIKAMKFSSFLQVCGGPIEIAVITTDRKFRWVRHKPWDAAIIDGESDVRTSHHHEHRTV